jgi:hypothetical protein
MIERELDSLDGELAEGPPDVVWSDRDTEALDVVPNRLEDGSRRRRPLSPKLQTERFSE